MGDCLDTYDQVCIGIRAICHATRAQSSSSHETADKDDGTGRDRIIVVACNTGPSSVCPVFRVCSKPHRIPCQCGHLHHFSLRILHQGFLVQNLKTPFGSQCDTHSSRLSSRVFWNHFIFKVTFAKLTWSSPISMIQPLVDLNFYMFYFDFAKYLINLLQCQSLYCCYTDIVTSAFK